MEPSPRTKAICLPIDCEEHYRQIIADPCAFRQQVQLCLEQHPELFPAAMSQTGFHLHSKRHCKKLDLPLRRIKIKATKQVFLIRPCFVLPYATAKVSEVEKGLYLRLFGVPFEALAYVFGKTASFWQRQWLALARPSLLGTTVKKPESLPTHLLADEKHTRLAGKKVYVPTVVAKGCILGASVTGSASEQDLLKGYKEFAQEAQQLDPDYQPQSVCLDGWSATANAFGALFPRVVVILCFLHSVLKIMQACLKRFGSLRRKLLDWAWNIYRAPEKRHFSQRVRRLKEWALKELDPGALQTAVLKLCAKRDCFAKAYEHPQGKRTSNEVDRLMDYQDRLLYQQRYFHGSVKTARLGVRAQAMLWNFHPYCARTRRNDRKRISPFVDLNGFSYHDNWLHNWRIASSMGGRPL